MTLTGLAAFDRAVHRANAWLADVAEELGTEDRHFAYRALRTWLHTVRDRLPVVSAAHFAAQLPELLRGVYYDGWDPAGVPMKYHEPEYATRFAFEAKIGLDQVRPVSRAVTAVVARHVTAGQLNTVFAQLPEWLRDLLDRDALAAGAGERSAARPAAEGSAAPAAGLPTAAEARLDSLEGEVRTLAEAVRVLAAGLEAMPLAEPGDDTGARAARRAHQILLTSTEASR
jgi:uncharacterized protein (DUF2267 family)